MVKLGIPAICGLAFLVLCSCGRGPVALNSVEGALAKASPGDTVVVKDGTYSDVLLKWEGRASADNPVVVVPQTPGGVVITGRSALSIYGEGLTVSSFLFERCTGDRGAVVEFRSGDALARGCRLTDCAFDDCNPARRDIAYSYVYLYGRGNRVDHCSLFGKKSLGVTLIVMLDHDGCDDNHHSIDHNWFGPRPVYGSNGAETMRVGTSHQCMQNSRTVIADNIFERCNGEVEVISIKSCENQIRDNVFYECQGVLALRHGDRNRAEGNLFLGHGVRNTGGVRIVGEDQVVRGNRFIGLAGSRFFSALALMYGVPNSLPNRYMQVRRTIVEGNDFQACAAIEFDTGSDMERTLAPVGTVWKDNRVSDTVNFEEPAFDVLAGGKGASWWRPTVQAENLSGEADVVQVASGDDLPSIASAAAPGTVLELTDSLYVLSESIPVRTCLVMRAAPGLRPRIIYAGDKSGNMVTIEDGGVLALKGLHFSGRPTPGRSAASAVIATGRDMVEPYGLSIDDCWFSDCGESGFFPVRGGKGTFAERVEIRRSRFFDLSGNAVYFAAETDDKGRYSGDDLIIEDCSFEHILGVCVNVYRGGTDESTAGPYVHIRGCSFKDCSNAVRGSVLRLIGPQVLEVSGCSFDGSGRGGYTIRLDEAPWERITISDNRFTGGSGPVLRNLK